VPTQVTETTPSATFEAALEDFFGAVRRGRARAARQVGAGELTLSQFALVGAFDDAEERQVGELAEAAGVAGPTATRMLDGLERRGIVERRPSESDRRVVTVRLTPQGRRMVERKRKLSREARRALYDSLTPSERTHAERLLRRLAEVIDQL
jgi:MarR family transcriptional regulator, organic hydroperoxide resistance regulator